MSCCSSPGKEQITYLTRKYVIGFYNFNEGMDPYSSLIMGLGFRDFRGLGLRAFRGSGLRAFRGLGAEGF